MARASTLKVVTAAAAALICAGTASAGWQEHASAFDANRLAKLDESKSKALAEAEKGASQADLTIIHAVLDPKPAQSDPQSLSGAWRCRTIKLGGMTADVVYSWFRCRISQGEDGLRFRKLTGSQLTNGTLYPDSSGALVYLGASSVKGEPPHAYSGGGAAAGAQATPDDQIGFLVATGPNDARLELPYPVQESTFDVIELQR
jgi:hypothetical protein